MKTPCQIVHWHLLPAIAAELAKQLKQQHTPQSTIASILGVTPAAVSQYLKKKRGTEAILSKAVKQRIKRLALQVQQQQISDCEFILGVCSICSVARRSGDVCTAHAREFDVGKNCDVCLGGRHTC